LWTVYIATCITADSYSWGFSYLHSIQVENIYFNVKYYRKSV